MREHITIHVFWFDIFNDLSSWDFWWSHRETLGEKCLYFFYTPFCLGWFLYLVVIVNRISTVVLVGLFQKPIIDGDHPGISKHPLYSAHNGRLYSFCHSCWKTSCTNSIELNLCDVSCFLHGTRVYNFSGTTLSRYWTYICWVTKFKTNTFICGAMYSKRDIV